MSFVLGVVVGVVLGAGLVLLLQLSRRREKSRAEVSVPAESTPEPSRSKPDRRAKSSWREKLNRPVGVRRRGSHAQPDVVHPPAAEPVELPVLEAVPVAEPAAPPTPVSPTLPPVPGLPEPTPALPEVHDLGFHVVAEPLAPQPLREQLPPPPPAPQPEPEPVVQIPVQPSPPVAAVETCPHCGISTHLFNRFCDVCQERVRSSRAAGRR